MWVSAAERARVRLGGGKQATLRGVYFCSGACLLCSLALAEALELTDDAFLDSADGKRHLNGGQSACRGSFATAELELQSPVRGRFATPLRCYGREMCVKPP
jgi:hypothetical protein